MQVFLIKRLPITDTRGMRWSCRKEGETRATLYDATMNTRGEAARKYADLLNLGGDITIKELPGDLWVAVVSY